MQYQTSALLNGDDFINLEEIYEHRRKNRYIPFIYRGYDQKCIIDNTIEPTQRMINEAVLIRINAMEDLFYRYTYDSLFNGYNKNHSLRNKTFLPQLDELQTRNINGIYNRG